MNTNPLFLKTTTLLLLFFLSSFSRAGNPDPASASLKTEQAFIRNSGQVKNNNGQSSDDVRYYTQVNNTTIYFRKNAVSYIQYNATKRDLPGAHAVHIQFLNSNPSATITSGNKSAATYHFYSTNTAQPIASEGYRELTYHNLYPNIDLVYKISEGAVKYDIVVRPGANMANIRFKVDGADELSIAKNKISIKTSLGEIVDEIPLSYYDDAARTTVDFIKLKQEGNIVSFEQVQTDKSKTLVIDPVLNFFNNFGPTTINGSGTGVSVGNSIYHEVNSGTTIVGYTNSLIFYQSPGAAYSIGSASLLAFVSYFNTSGVMQWSTTMQGEGDIVFNDVLATGGLIFAVGTTYNDLPGTNTNTPPAGSSADAFLSMLNTSGTLLRNYYIGGTNDDGATSIVNGGYVGGILVGGYSYSTALNGTNNGYGWQGDKDGFVVSLKPDPTPSFTNYGYTFLGSPQEDEVTDLDYLASTDKIAVTGTTRGTAAGFVPSLTNVFGSNSSMGDRDVFVVSMYLPSNSGTGLYVANYRGSIGTDAGDELFPRVAIRKDASVSAVNDFDVAFLTTASGLNTVTTLNAYQKNITASFYNNFYVSLNTTLSTVKYASYFRRAVASPPTSAFAVKVDWMGNKFLSGTTNEAAFPLTQNITVNNKVPGTPATNTTDIFVARLNPDFSLGYMALTGDDYTNYVNEIDVTRQQETSLCATAIYLTGVTNLTSGVSHAIHAKLTDNNPISLASSNGTSLPTTLSIANAATFTGTVSIQWYFNGMPFGDPFSTITDGLQIYANLPGDYYAVVTYSGCTLQTQTLTFAINCTAARSYKDLRAYVNEQVALGNTEMYINQDRYQIPAGQVVTIPSGYSLTIHNSIVVAFECARIEVTGTGVLDIDGSVLTACNRWDGVLYNGAGTSGVISNTGISNAAVAVYKYYGSTVSGPVIEVNTSNFNNNSMHAAVLLTYAGSPLAGVGNNKFEQNRMFSLAAEKCGTASAYTQLKSNSGGYSCYLFGMGMRTGLLMILDNYFYGTTLSGSRFITVKGRSLTNVVIDYNRYRGMFRSGVDVATSISIACHYEHVKCDQTDYAYRIVNATSENGLTVENSYIENTGSAAIAGISMKNTHLNSIASNRIKGYTNGIEYYNNQYLPFITLDHSKRSDIEYNVIQPGRSGVVLSYTQDPYGAALGSNNSPSNYELGVWVKCNRFIGGNYGILGSGFLIDQLISVPGSPGGGSITVYYNPGNEFNGVVNWDIIWDNVYNASASGFTYYAPAGNTLNTGTLTNITMNGHTVGLATNDFTIATTFPGGAAVQSVACAPSADQHAPAMKPTGLLNKETAPDMKLSVYPNPSHGTFMVGFNGQQTDRVEIIDMLGREVYRNHAVNTSGQLEINGSNWAPGVYFIRLYHNNALIGSQKLIREN